MIEELFQDRLDAFLEKSLSDIVQFATREERPVEEIRRCVAEWHARYLFTESGSELTNNSSKLDRARTIRIQLNETSRALETLNATTGMHSLLLAVDPLDASDPGFVYGTAPARDFWRGLRGGGEKGISALRSQARKTLVPPTTGTTLGEGTSSKGPAYKLKTEVYSRVRSALRTISGVPNADMKWTNHENLLTYGVRIEGWPPEIPLQNPSTLSVAHNNAVKAALDAGTLRFRRIEDTAPDPPPDTQLPWDLLDESLRPDIPTVPHASSELLVHPASIMVASAQRSSGENDITSNG